MTGQLAILEFPSEGFGRPQVNALVTAADGSVWALCQTSESDAEDAAYVWFLVRFASDGAYLETIRLDFSGSQLEQSQVYLTASCSMVQEISLRGLFGHRLHFWQNRRADQSARSGRQVR